MKCSFVSIKSKCTTYFGQAEEPNIWIKERGLPTPALGD